MVKAGQPVEINSLYSTYEAVANLIGMGWQVAVAEVTQGLEGDLRIEGPSMDLLGRRKVRGQIDARPCDQGIKIDVVLGLGAFLHNGRLHAREVDHVGDPKAGLRNDERVSDAVQSGNPEKPHLNRSAALHKRESVFLPFS